MPVFNCTSCNCVYYDKRFLWEEDVEDLKRSEDNDSQESEPESEDTPRDELEKNKSEDQIARRDSIGSDEEKKKDPNSNFIDRHRSTCDAMRASGTCANLAGMAAPVAHVACGAVSAVGGVVGATAGAMQLHQGLKTPSGKCDPHLVAKGSVTTGVGATCMVIGACASVCPPLFFVAAGVGAAGLATATSLDANMDGLCLECRNGKADEASHFQKEEAAIRALVNKGDFNNTNKRRSSIWWNSMFNEDEEKEGDKAETARRISAAWPNEWEPTKDEDMELSFSPEFDDQQEDTWPPKLASSSTPKVPTFPFPTQWKIARDEFVSPREEDERSLSDDEAKEVSERFLVPEALVVRGTVAAAQKNQKKVWAGVGPHKRSSVDAFKRRNSSSRISTTISYTYDPNQVSKQDDQPLVSQVNDTSKKGQDSQEKCNVKEAQGTSGTDVHRQQFEKAMWSGGTPHARAAYAPFRKRRNSFGRNSEVATEISHPADPAQTSLQDGQAEMSTKTSDSAQMPLQDGQPKLSVKTCDPAPRSLQDGLPEQFFIGDADDQSTPRSCNGQNEPESKRTELDGIKTEPSESDGSTIDTDATDSISPLDDDSPNSLDEQHIKLREEQEIEVYNEDNQPENPAVDEGDRSERIKLAYAEFL